MPTPLPSSTTLSGSQRPDNNGDTYGFTGTRVQTQSFNPFATSSPPPIANPLPSSASQTTTTQISQVVTVSTNQTFNGQSGLSDFHVVENDTNALQATSVTSDNYLSFPSGTTGNIYLEGSTQSASTGATYSTTFQQNGNLVDTLPETAGTLATTTYTYSTNESDPDGATAMRNVNADGSYIENDSYPDGTSAKATENSDGSGTYSLPLAGVGPPNGSANTVVQISVPAANPGAPSTMAIPIMITYPKEIFGGNSPNVVNRYIGVWYPNGSATPLFTTSTKVATNLLTSSIPSACTSPQTIFGNGPIDSLTQTNQTVDTVFGEIDNFTQTTYTVRGYGPFCVTLGDNLQQYYDYSGQQVKLVGTSSVPYGSTVTTQTLSLQRATIVGTNAVHRRNMTGGERFAASIPAYALARTASTGFRASLDRARLTRHAALRRTLRALGGIR